MSNSSEHYCRGCGGRLDNTPLISYLNMPGRAQHFPDKQHLDEDQGVDLNLYRCRGCGLLQLTNEPVYYYKDVIRAASVSEEMHKFRVEFFKEFMTKYNLFGHKLVEIGAGNGEFMNYIQEAGGDIYGIEHNQESVEYCISHGLRVEEGFPDESYTKYQNGPFDGFFIMSYMEHIPDLRYFLSNIADNLNDGAIGLIEVPNTDMVMDHMLFSEFMLDHLSYFTKESLTRVMEVNGFDVLDVRPVWYDYNLCAIVQKRKTGSIGDFKSKQDEVISSIHRYIDSYIEQGKKVAVWGAGHQALAVISLSQIASKIEFVIDSADFKQNKYTPGSHCLVVAPDKLLETHIDTILVMCASYSDEVYHTIKTKYKGIVVVILREDGLEFME